MSYFFRSSCLEQYGCPACRSENNTVLLLLSCVLKTHCSVCHARLRPQDTFDVLLLACYNARSRHTAHKFATRRTDVLLYARLHSRHSAHKFAMRRTSVLLYARCTLKTHCSVCLSQACHAWKRQGLLSCDSMYQRAQDIATLLSKD